MIHDLTLMAHVIGATVLIGSGAAIAFFMLAAHLTRAPETVARVAGLVVLADWLFTATAAVAQPITGYALTRMGGWPLTAPWVAWSLGLYVLVGALWLPVVAIQIRMRDLARAAAAAGEALPPAYRRLFRIWIACGAGAFPAVLAILWLMLTKPG